MTRPHIDFDWRVNLGHLLTAASLMIVGAVGYVNLERDVVENAEAIGRNEARDAVRDQRLDINSARLNAKDVADGQLQTRLISIDKLLEEVRDELKEINRRPAP